MSEGVATKADLRAEIATLEARLTWRMVAVAQAGTVVALIKLL